MVLNLCFREQQPFFAHNFKRKSTRYSIVSLQVAFLSSANSYCYSSEYCCKINTFLFPITLARDWKRVKIARLSVENN